MTLEDFWDIALDSLVDAAKILPVILVIYILIELIESHGAASRKFKKLLTAKSAPLFAATIGVIPQCGFSVVATKLYQGGYILLGTLIAVYFATSDEALPILFSKAFENPSLWGKLGLLILIKVGYAVLVGFLINAAVKNKSLNAIDEKVVQDVGEDGCCNHDVTEERHGFLGYLLHPLLHSLKIFTYIFVINIVFGLIIGFVGKNNIAQFLSSNIFLQPLVSTVIGLIPNCASSVLITQMFASNALSLGGAVAGLTVNSGLGVAVLLKDKNNLKSTLLIILLMFTLSLILGYAVTAVSLLF